jgi:hypothetical protein
MTTLRRVKCTFYARTSSEATAICYAPVVVA